MDGTYEGDLIHRCGVPTTYGREANTTYNETLAGVLPEPSSASAGHCQFNRTGPGSVNPYINGTAGTALPGIPAAGRRALPGSADSKVMAYTFRLCITNRTDIRVPFSRPAGYLPADWELMARFIAAKQSTRPDDYIWRFALPDGKFDLCNFGPLSTMPVGPQWGWPSGNASDRTAIFEQHKRFVAGFM